MPRRHVQTMVSVCLIAVLFGVPLFFGLRNADLENDEAIYSYSVERMLALRDWMTPRGIYDGADNPMLEKPPLKIWIVAAGLSAGLPRDEFGLRFFDALFGALSFIYVFALGRRLAGSLCGLVAVLTLFTFRPLVLEHGLRTNNMEAALMLTYCGGIYHLVRWAEDAPDGRRRHAWFAAGFFAFGFLSKFVGALFLPLVIAVALVWRRDGVSKARDFVRESLWPAAAALAIIAPWFLYQTAVRGTAFWKEIFGHQVFTRFTAFLDPNHLRPWHYYAVQAWGGFVASGAIVLVVVGLAWLLLQALVDRWLPRVLLVWWLLPFALISAMTSKLPHYAYPFLPPLAIAAGAAASAWLNFWKRRSRGWNRPVLRAVVGIAALAALLVAIWSARTGPLVWRLGGVRLLRSEGAIRPLVLGLVLLAATASMRTAIRIASIAVLVLALPLPAYVAELQEFRAPHYPLRAIRDCAEERLASGIRPAGAAGTHWFVAGHSFFYYFRSLGPYGEVKNGPDVERRLFSQGAQTPVVFERSQIGPGIEWQLFPIIDFGPFVVGLPGPYASCEGPALAAGGRRVELASAQR